MIKNKFGELVYSKQDIMSLIMQGHSINNIIVDSTVTVDNSLLDNPLIPLTEMYDTVSVPQFDYMNQQEWMMPAEYKQLDIAEHLLSLCATDAELQRVGQELLLYNDRNLFDLLRYLKYLVDTMKEHNIIWGVGRGSSVASYVLYLLGVHKIDSMYYDLDPEEFLR
jgi:DNA polymerase III alpha subunit